jgi:hypothetical protein
MQHSEYVRPESSSESEAEGGDSGHDLEDAEDGASGNESDSVFCPSQYEYEKMHESDGEIKVSEGDGGQAMNRPERETSAEQCDSEQNDSGSERVL